MFNYDYSACIEKIELVDENTAYENMIRLFPDYNVSKDENDFWDRYIKAKKVYDQLFVPFCFLMKFHKNDKELAFNRALVYLFENLSRIDETVYIGVSAEMRSKFEDSLFPAAEYLTKIDKLYVFEEKYIIALRYRKDFNNIKRAYVIEKNDELHIMILKDIDDVSSFRYETVIADHVIPEHVAKPLLSCMQSDYRKFALKQHIYEDDRCYIDDAFSIEVSADFLKLPKDENGWYKYRPIEYFYRGEKSTFKEFNELLSFVYSVLPLEERNMFPFE